MTTARVIYEGLDETLAKNEAIKHFFEKQIADEGTESGDRVAIRKGQSLQTSGDAEIELHSLAKVHAAKHSISFAKAMTEVLNTDEGRTLYAKSQARPPIDEGAIARRAQISKAMTAMQADADQRYTELAKSMRREGETIAQAYVRAIRERPEIYNATEVAKRRVAA